MVEFINVIPAFISVPAGVTDSEVFYQNTPLFGAIGWGVLFRGPTYALFGTLPLLIIFLIFEWKNISNKWLYVAVWTLAGVGASLRLAGIPAGIICGFLYWILAGRLAGIQKSKLSNSSTKATTSFGRAIGYGLLLYIGYIVLGYVWYGYKMLEVTIREPSRGTPAFVGYREGFLNAYGTHKKKIFGSSARPQEVPELSIFHKVALRDFPSAESCMKGAVFASQKYDLFGLDWEKINNEYEAEVCTFRMLKTLGGIENVTPWLEAQGFTSSENFSSANPHKTSYGTLSIHGSYSIRNNGPKFPTSGFVRRAFRSIPYSMGIETAWSIDGKELLYARYTFSTL